MIFSTTAKLPDHIVIEGHKIALIFTPKDKAKNMILRYHAPTKTAKITLPKKWRLPNVLQFLENHKYWIKTQYEHRTIPTIIEQGYMPFLGRKLTINHLSGRGIAYYEQDQLYLYGMVDLWRNHIKQFLKKQALLYFKQHLPYYLKTLHYDDDVPLKIGDMTSCWGYCHKKKGIKLQYRLLMADETIAQYVLAHEVCHLRHPNHSKEFWSEVENLYPQYKISRQWLKKNGWQYHCIL